MINAIGEKDVSALADAIENDFECLYPVFKETEALLHSLGAKRSFLCGSGPTVCGIFENKEDADRALQKLFGEYAFLAEIGTDNN